MTPPVILGIGAAFLTALCQSASDVGTKAATREAEERLILAAQWCAGALLLCLVCVVVHPQLLHRPIAVLRELTKPDFWPLVAASTTLNVAAYLLFVRAFRLAEASLVAPLMLLTPVLLLATSPIMVGERVSPLGGFGVVLSVVGAIILASSEPGSSPTASLKTFLRDEGVHAMSLTAAIWSVTANLDKLGLRASTPMIWITAISGGIALASVGLWLATARGPVRLRALRWAFAAGAANALGNAVQMYALTLLFVPYVIAIKRMSALFTVLVGGMAFRENIRARLLGAGVMFAGAALVAFAQG
jgi:drug/metabolite transporter (DMT)-like permease